MSKVVEEEPVNILVKLVCGPLLSVNSPKTGSGSTANGNLVPLGVVKGSTNSGGVPEKLKLMAIGRVSIP